MPEGPEVKYMINKISKKFKNSKLKEIIINGGTYKKNPLPIKFKYFLKNLPSKILDIKNKGKFIYFKFNNNINLCITLSLTGHFLLKKDKYCIYEFKTNKGNFYLQDMRTFARFYFMNDEELNKKLNKIGPDILENKITYKNFKERIEKRIKQKIGIVLVDQKIISGIGNYIRSDSLYLAKISPYRYVKDITDNELKILYKSIKKIVKKSYNDINKKNDMRGYEFMVYRRKYTKKGEIVKREKLEKSRNIYWCPEVQK